MSTLGKRCAEDDKRPNKRARQREMKRVAHHISTQSASSTNMNSKMNHQEEEANKIIKFPNQIQVDKNLSSYSYEIQAIQNAIKSSSFGSSIRAWQMLPRHKRRRNASHNLLALPKRLRNKGKAELKASTTIPRSRSEIRKRRGKGNRLTLGAYPRKRESIRRRELIQRASKAVLLNKAWMETHLWHAKRFRMSGVTGKVVGGNEIHTADRWDFSLPEESSMKSYRSTWRDDKKGATVMDASYNVWIRITASVRVVDDMIKAQDDLASILRKAGLIDGWQEEWRKGKECCNSIFTAPVKGQDSSPDLLRCRGPVQSIWVQHDEAELLTSNQRKRSEVLLCTHPEAASTLLRSLHTAVVALSRGLSSQFDIRRLNSFPHPVIVAGSGATARRHGRQAKERITTVQDKFLDSLEKKWMRLEAFNTFELGGRLSANLLLKVLRPINKEASSKMDTIQKGTFKDGTIIPFEVHDPRLSFPPRFPTKKPADVVTSTEWPSHSRLLTQGCPPPNFRKGEIDRRKSKLTIPGSRLLPTSQDDVVSVVVIAHQQRANGEKTFALLVPRAWGQAFWLSLVHPETRILGQVMSRALDFEKGRPSFPFDWAGTPGFERQEETESIIASEEWLRKPPAKRCNVNKIGVKWPFGGSGLWVDVVRQGQNVALSHLDRDENTIPWLLATTTTSSLDSLTQAYRSWNHNLTMIPDSLLIVKSALVCVKLTACRKGVISKWDEIHFLDKVQQAKWKKALFQVQKDSHSKLALQKLESQPLPSSQTHIGSVTTGNFNLSNGKVSAIASISLLALLEIITAQEEPSNITLDTKKIRNPIPLDNLVLIKSCQGGICRAASLQIVSLV